MKVTIVTCYESNEERVAFVKEACEERGYEVRVITSDFSHVRKTVRNSIPEGYHAIRTKPYYRNLSLTRLLSHRRFAKDAFDLIGQEDADLLWVIAPANSLIKEAARYQRKHPHAPIIIDIIDMWPESLPLRYDMHAFPFSLWRNVRKKHLYCADHLVSECDFYQQILKEEYSGKITTIHWAKDEEFVRQPDRLSGNGLSLLYLGSINHIIDIDAIAKIISHIDEHVTLHVVGDGESREAFVNELSRICEVIYYGEIRDEQRKSEIFSKCHAGINIYKDGLYIGLTVKCIDYFGHGLPIINNIKGDTYEMVEKNDLGINVAEDSIVSAKQLKQLRQNNEHIYAFYQQNFSKAIFKEKCLQVIDEVLQ
ncbi:MAG: glycosyltransferase [Erysipelotrichaceae bacterium]|nr:glycosyltransferase [Erysipelotrichaceae bacterium]